MGMADEKTNRDRIRTRWVILLLALSFLANFLFIDWGMPNHYSWAPDAVHPYFIFHGMEKKFSGGWFQKYPPFHYILTAAAYLPAMAFCEGDDLDFLFQKASKVCESKVNPSVDFLDRSTEREVTFLFILVGRGLNAFMETLLTLALFLWAGELFGKRAGWFAALIAAFHPLTIFYAHTMNTEAPYFMWAAFGLYFYARVLKRQDLLSYLGLGVCAALATSTKEQALGLFALLPPLIVYSRAVRIGDGSFRVKNLGRALGDRYILFGAGAFILTFVLANNLVFNFKGFMTHLEFNRPGVSVLQRVYPLTLEGCAGLTWESLKWLAETASWPMILICLFGLAVTALKDTRTALAHLLPALSYFVVFIGYIGFVMPRYMTPVFYVLAVFGGRALADLQGWARIPAAARAVVLSAIGTFIFMMGFWFTGLLKDDPRYEAEEWIESNIPQGSKVQFFVGPQNALCRLPPDRDYPPLLKFEDLARSKQLLPKIRPDYLVVHVFGERIFGTPPAKWLDGFRRNFRNLGYEIVKVCEPKWRHPALYYLHVNPHVIVAKPLARKE